MVKRRGPPSQGWRTFLRNHAPDIAAMDLFVVPTIGFDLLYASSSGSTAEISSGSTSQQTRQRSGLRVRSRRPSLGMMPQNTSSAIGIKSMARSSPADCAPWASGTSPPHRRHLGKMALPPGRTSSPLRPCLSFRYIHHDMIMHSLRIDPISRSAYAFCQGE